MRHLRWIIPLACIPAIYLLVVGGWAAIHPAGVTGQESVRRALVELLIPLVGLAAMIVAAVLAIVGGVRVFRTWRRRTGHLPAHERVALARARDEASARERAWRYAIWLRGALLRREVPPSIDVWHVVPRPGEVFFFDADIEYERYYGRDVSYTQQSSLWVGRPAFVLAGVVATGIGNNMRRNAAELEAMTQWRERQATRVIVSNQRLVCLAAGQWLSFDYGAMTAIYPEAGAWTFACEFSSAAPLRLRGLNAPAVAVLTVFSTMGPDALARHPGMAALGPASSAP